MRRTLLDDGWTVGEKTNPFAERMGSREAPLAVTLPHDAMLGSARSASGKAASAYFPGGVWVYRRSLAGPARDAETCVLLEFEGVYRDALVSVNENVVAHRPSGYANFVVPVDHLLRADEMNEIKVEARAYEDSRWYTGGGIYRSVWLLQAGRVHLEPGGTQVTTPEIDDDVAVVCVASALRNCSTKTSQAALRVEVFDGTGAVVGQSQAPVTTFPGDRVAARQRLCLATPHRWNMGDPYLYTCRVTLLDGEDVLDEDETTFGIRSLTLDPRRGLRINGETVLLRGACVHHDNGPLGAATIDRAEERRVELLKAAGFNAIRSAHNPMSKPMLRACDRLGVLVMDETFDMWEQPKSEHDYALRFPDAWEADVEAMVRKDFNHPSVILYSIGNEILEAGRPAGARLGRRLAERIRALDDTRFVTEALSGLLAGGPEMFEHLGRAGGDEQTDEATGVNTALTNLADQLSQLMLSPAVDRNSAETLSYLDVAGYNYMESRLELDGTLHPNRVIVGTETWPYAIDSGWAAVTANPHVIGDFTWTGWDYLGEAGIGRVVHGDAEQLAFHGDYPWLAAWCGDIDITGHRRPQSYYREIVYGLRAQPYIAVQRPTHHGERTQSTPWSWSDAVSSWSWEGHENAPITVEVYASAPEVELRVNGRSVGTRPAGVAHGYRAVFETVYEPGLIEAITAGDGADALRTSLRSASGPVLLEVSADRSVISADTRDLAFLALTLVDPEGALHSATVRQVEVRLEGPGVLQALGSADPAGDGHFAGTACTTFDGRALAVIRPTGAGRITVTATAEGDTARLVHIDARPL